MKSLPYIKRILPALMLVFFVCQGCIYVNVKAPFDTDLNRTEMGHKTGTADAYSILWLAAWGDASYAAAAANGGITELKHADQKIFQLLFGLYTHWTVVVYGD
ncbi:MAG: TRL domain-containing protein [Pseudomonadota bacterium]